MVHDEEMVGAWADNVNAYAGLLEVCEKATEDAAGKV